MTDIQSQFPETTDQLDDLLSTPDQRVVRTMELMEGDIVVLGVGGKMGPTFARMLRRATELAGRPRRIFGVSRFGSRGLQEKLETWGVETIACDVLDEPSVEQLPDVANVVSMLGYKFGAARNPALTWAMNCYVPAVISRRYRASQITAFSSGNVYGNVAVESGGSVETDVPKPVGEYAFTVLGRERIYEHFSRRQRTPMTLLRLNYATELRYGVLVDLAQQVHRGTPIDLAMGYVNVIWQRDANAMAANALSFTDTPPRILNIAGEEILPVRDVCTEFGRQMNVPVKFVGAEASNALLNKATQNYEELGKPTKSAGEMIAWTARWVMEGGETLGKPTHFASRDGTF